MSKSVQSKNKVLETLEGFFGIFLKFPKYNSSKRNKDLTKQKKSSDNSLSLFEPENLQNSKESTKHHNKSKGKNFSLSQEEQIIQHKITEFDQFIKLLSKEIASVFYLSKKNTEYCTKFIHELVIDSLDEFVKLENSDKQFVIKFVNSCNSFFEKNDNSSLHRNIALFVSTAVNYYSVNPLLDMMGPPPFRKPHKLKKYKNELQEILKETFLEYKNLQGSHTSSHIQSVKSEVESKFDVFTKITDSVENDKSIQKPQQTEQQYIGQFFANYGSLNLSGCDIYSAEEASTESEKLLLGQQ